jgi:hypothetical protein
LSESDIIKMLVSKIYFEEQKKAELDFSDPSDKELLHQASKTFGVSSLDNEPENLAKIKRR